MTHPISHAISVKWLDLNKLDLDRDIKVIYKASFYIEERQVEF